MNCFPCCRSSSDVETSSTKRNPRLLTRSRATFTSIVATLSLKKGSSRHRQINAEILKHGTAKNEAKLFKYEELAAATDNFSPSCRVGEGGFGRVYKGYLQSINQTVAVKQLDRKGMQGNREFLTEVLMLSLVQHPNLVRLIGYCCEEDHRILVYEYMSSGSLESHLLDLASNKEPLDWYTRMKIAQGAARGLEYLHHTAEPLIIYRDFKSSNILLDENFDAKLSDFGLAKLGPTRGENHVSTRVMGTYGYCAPEYVSTGQLTTKSDVYSFGVVFLEIITGRRVIDNARPTAEQNLIEWAQPLLKDRKKFTLMADPLLKDNFPEKGLFQALAVAAMCLQEESETRPLMDDIVVALEHLAKPINEYYTKDESTIGAGRAGHVESFKRTCALEDQQI